VVGATKRAAVEIPKPKSRPAFTAEKGAGGGIDLHTNVASQTPSSAFNDNVYGA